MINAGLRRLQQGQRHGQTFTCREIGDAVGAKECSISWISRRAEAAFAERLIASLGPAEMELIAGTRIHEVLTRVKAQKRHSSDYRAAKSVRVKERPAKRVVDRTEQDGIASLTEVAKILERRNAKAAWGRRTRTV